MEQMDGCPVCSGEQRTTWILTHLSPPATVHSCEEHAQLNVITLLAVLLNVDGAWLYEVIANAVNAAAEEHDNPPVPEPEAKPKARQRRAAPAEDTEAVEDAAV